MPDKDVVRSKKRVAQNVVFTSLLVLGTIFLCNGEYFYKEKTSEVNIVNLKKEKNKKLHDN